ncbi:MAG: hypothetical protein AAB780_00675 [Patescibacteria group bacterium]
MLKQKQFKLVKEQIRIIKCPDGLCPAGIDTLKEVTLTPEEKRSIYFRLKDQIFRQKLLLRKVPLF